MSPIGGRFGSARHRPGGEGDALPFAETFTTAGMGRRTTVSTTVPTPGFTRGFHASPPSRLLSVLPPTDANQPLVGTFAGTPCGNNSAQNISRSTKYRG